MNNLYKITFSTFLLFCFFQNLHSDILNVPDLYYPTIQAGIDSSSHGDTVLVANGTYFENINFNGKNIVLCSEFIFSNDTTDVAETVIDGGTNACVVVFENIEDSTAVLCGFTITNGYSFLNPNRGGGISCLNNASPMLSNLVIINNEVDGDDYFHGGAGILCSGNSLLTIINVKIIKNTAEGCSGGAIKATDSSKIIIKNSLIQNNKSKNGTIAIFDSYLELFDVKIEQNNTSITGGGIHSSRAEAIIENSEIVRNHVRVMGGGIYSEESIFSFNNVNISLNSATEAFEGGVGGGLYVDQNSILSFERATINNNVVQGGGGGIYVRKSFMQMKNASVRGNTVLRLGDGGGISGHDNAEINLENVEIIDNYTPYNGGGIYYGSDNVVFSLSSVSIYRNKADKEGGGIFCRNSSNLIFSEDYPSSIYLNKAHDGGADISIRSANIIQAAIDSFTVSNPSAYHLYPLDKFNLSIQNPLFFSVENDLYVSQNGSDSNSGISPDESLRSVNSALLFASVDSINQRNIYIEEGCYSALTSGEDFPLYARSNISLVGQNMETTIVDAKFKARVIQGHGFKNFKLKNLTFQNGHESNRKGLFNGGGVSFQSGLNIELESLVVANNRAQLWGGGIFLSGGTHDYYLMKNVLINNNSLDSSGYAGAGIYLGGLVGELINVTIADNFIYGNSDLSGGLHVSGVSDVSVINSIIVNNSNYNVVLQQEFGEPQSVKIAYSDIQGGIEGIKTDSTGTLHWLDGNIDEDPIFISGEPYSYYLKAESPCIDSGIAFLVFEGDTLVSLLPEEYEGSAPDMGAFGIAPVNCVKEETLVPKQLQLNQNYPNPFNNTTTISYQLVKPGDVNLSIYDITGQLVQVLENGKKLANKYKFIWTATEYASGIYFIRLSTENHVAVRKMLLVK